MVVTYNGIKWIRKCLESLQLSTTPVSVIVVDNGSQDGTCELVENYFPLARLIRNTANLGFGRANNVGLNMALKSNADAVFLLNQDAWVENDTIGTLFQEQQKEPGFYILSPLHVNGKGSALDFNFSTYLQPENCPNLISDLALNKNTAKIYESNFVNAAAWMLSRKCIDEVGGFNPVFFMYSEDVNYIDRVHFHGGKVGIYPAVKIFHDREMATFRTDRNNYFSNTALVRESHPLTQTETETQILQHRLLRKRLALKWEDVALIKNQLQSWNKIKPAVLDSKIRSREKGHIFLDDE